MRMRRNEWWVPGKIVEAREQLQHFWRVQLHLQQVSHGLWQAAQLPRTKLHCCLAPVLDDHLNSMTP